MEDIFINTSKYAKYLLEYLQSKPYTQIAELKLTIEVYSMIDNPGLQLGGGNPMLRVLN